MIVHFKFVGRLQNFYLFVPKQSICSFAQRSHETFLLVFGVVSVVLLPLLQILSTHDGLVALFRISSFIKAGPLWIFISLSYLFECKFAFVLGFKDLGNFELSPDKATLLNFITKLPPISSPNDPLDDTCIVTEAYKTLQWSIFVPDTDIETIRIVDPEDEIP